MTGDPFNARFTTVGKKVESRVKQFTRWVSNDNIEFEIYFLPYAEALLASLAMRPLDLVMEGSTVGRGCLALLVSVVYQKRALPLAWLVVKGRKGHFPETSPLTLLAQVHAMMPAHAQVTFLGDGEFDGMGLEDAVEGYGWRYAERAARPRTSSCVITITNLLLKRFRWNPAHDSVCRR